MEIDEIIDKNIDITGPYTSMRDINMAKNKILDKLVVDWMNAPLDISYSLTEAYYNFVFPNPRSSDKDTVYVVYMFNTMVTKIGITNNLEQRYFHYNREIEPTAHLLSITLDREIDESARYIEYFLKKHFINKQTGRERYKLNLIDILQVAHLFYEIEEDTVLDNIDDYVSSEHLPNLNMLRGIIGEKFFESNCLEDQKICDFKQAVDLSGLSVDNFKTFRKRGLITTHKDIDNSIFFSSNQLRGVRMYPSYRKPRRNASCPHGILEYL